MTDSTNIRWYYGDKGQLIFNWENNKRQLRVHDLLTGEKAGVNNAGCVEEGKLHDFEFLVTQTRFQVRVDRRKVYETKGSFSQINAPLGGWPCPGQ